MSDDTLTHNKNIGKMKWLPPEGVGKAGGVPKTIKTGAGAVEMAGFSARCIAEHRVGVMDE